MTSTWRRLNMHRDHRWAGPRISSYVDEELPERSRRRLAAHERICPECGRTIATLRSMLEALRPGKGRARTSDPEARKVVERALDRAMRQAGS